MPPPRSSASSISKPPATPRPRTACARSAGRTSRSAPTAAGSCTARAGSARQSRPADPADHAGDPPYPRRGCRRRAVLARCRAAGARSLAAPRRARRAPRDFEEQFCTPALTRGADWICTWKCALRLWPDSPELLEPGAALLAQAAGLEHERGLPAHRAFPDAYVTAFHLRDMLNEASVAQLIEWSNAPGPAAARPLRPRSRQGLAARSTTTA